MSKAQRQQVVSKLIERQQVTSQTQLIELLADHGLSVTQATVSRDLDDLGAVKVRAAGGTSVYAIPDLAPERVAPVDHVRRVLGEWVGEVTSSGNLVVLRTPPGCAHVVGSALDRSIVDGLLGCVAGDDTLICVAAEHLGGAGLATALAELAGIERS